MTLILPIKKRFFYLSSWSEYWGPLQQAFLFHQDNEGSNLAQIDRSLRRVLEPDYFSFVLRGLADGFNSVRFGPRGRWLVAAANDDKNNLRIWDMRDVSAASTKLAGHTEGVNEIAFSPDGKWLASGGFDGNVRVWSLNDLSNADGVESLHATTLPGLDESVTSVQFSPDGKWIAAAGEEKAGRLWNVSKFERAPKTLTPPSGNLRAVSFTQDSMRIAGGSDDGSVVLWHLSALDSPTALKVNRNEVIRPDRLSVNELLFTPDGSKLISSDMSSVRIWNLVDVDAMPQVLTANGGDREETVALSADGRWLATGSNEIQLWNLASESPRRVTVPNDGSENSKLVQWINELAISSDSRWLSAARADGTVRLWDLNNLSKDPRTLQTDRDTGATSVAFSSEVKWLAVGNTDGRLRVWSLQVAVQSVRSVERGRFWLGLVCGEDGVIQEAFPIG